MRVLSEPDATVTPEFPQKNSIGKCGKHAVVAACALLWFACALPGESVAANAAPAQTASVRQPGTKAKSRPLKQISAKKSYIESSRLLARVPPGEGSGTDDSQPATRIEESLLLSKLPENIDLEHGQLNSVGGSSSIDISLPETVSRYSETETVNSLNLSQAILGAYGFSRDIKMAEARKEQAISQSNQARGLLLPTLTLRSGRGNETSSPASVTDATTGSAKLSDKHLRKDDTITLKQALFDGPSFLDWQRRDLLVDSREGALLSTRGDAYVATIQAFLNVVSTKLLSELNQEYEQQLGFLFDYVSKRASAGASSHSDMERVRARALAAKSARIEQETAHAAAVLEFVRITNLAPKTLILPRREEANREMPEVLAKGIDLALETNPDIQTLKAELEAVDKEINAAKSRYLPRVDFELSDSKVTNAGGPTGLQHDQRAMVVMTWSILNGGTDYYNFREKQQKRTESYWKLEDQQRRLRQTLSAQYATLDATKSRIAAGYKEWASTYSAAHAMSQRMLSGNQSLLDLLDALDRVQQARARLINLHYVEIVSVAQISRLIGKFPDADQLATQASARLPGNRNGK